VKEWTVAGNDYALVLSAGRQLSRRAVSCPTGEYTVVHQHDGDVVLYRNADSAVVWATGTRFQDGVTSDLAQGRAGRLALEDDGDLVVYSADGERLWTSGTAGRPVASLMIHDWGKLVLKNAQGHILWQTDRAPKRWDGWNAVPDGRRLRRGQSLRNHSLVSDNGRYTFVADASGARYLCRTDGPILWAVFDSPGDGCELTEDGRFIGRSADGIPRPGNFLGGWSEPPASELLVTDQGHLVLVDSAGQVLWSKEPPKPTARARRPRRRKAPAGVPPLPSVESVPVVRTDFSDDAAWTAAVDRVASPYEWSGPDPVQADVVPVEDARYDGLVAEQLLTLVPQDACWPILVVADASTMTSPDHSMLVLNLDADGHGESLRATPAAIVEMEINLSLANMDWDDFSGNADDDGVVQSIEL
jgi:uncharacterized protein DUF6924